MEDAFETTLPGRKGEGGAELLRLPKMPSLTVFSSLALLITVVTSVSEYTVQLPLLIVYTNDQLYRTQ